MAKVRDLVASAVGRIKPDLFYYLANQNARRSVRVRLSSDTIDVIRPASCEIIRIARKNSLYLVNIVNQFDDFAAAVAPVNYLARGVMYKLIDFSTPRFHKISGFDDFPILCPSLTESHTTNQESINFAALTPGEVALDLGSYNGLTSIAFSKDVGSTGRVIALEPDPLNFAAASENIVNHRRLNGLSNIDLLPAAASAADGILQLSSEGATGSALTSIVGGHRGRTVDVEAMTLQTLAGRCHLDRVDFIKIDIEGAERELVPQSGEFFRRYRPRLLVEPHRVEGTSTAAVIKRSLAEFGYSFSTMEHRGLSMPFIAAQMTA